jgi:hypothetical protein
MFESAFSYRKENQIKKKGGGGKPQRAQPKISQIRKLNCYNLARSIAFLPFLFLNII